VPRLSSKLPSRAPKWADAQFSLASVYARIDRVPEALDHLNLTLELLPDHYRANLLKGRIFVVAGESRGIAAVSEEGRRGSTPVARSPPVLGDALEQAGDVTGAQQQRQAAQAARERPAPLSPPTNLSARKSGRGFPGRIVKLIPG
jgi:tetratricopeptide (TPR) repeat protein